jgi:ribosomal protein S18 acetylase RimI-like enzyme
MPELKYFPISRLDETFLSTLLEPLMEEEEKAWMSDLGWDYGTIRQILASFIKKKQLPGYVSLNSQKAIGYSYFLINRMRGIIGALYACNTDQSQDAVEQLLSLAISSLKDLPNVRRIESQIIPFHNLSISNTFAKHGFSCFSRYYLDLNLNDIAANSGLYSSYIILPWRTGDLESAAEMTAISYRNQIDAEICEDYRTKPGCRNYLRSLLQNPGCGFYMPKASFIALDKDGLLSGFLISSRISERMAMIPQIAVHPSHQGRGLGNRLIHRSLKELKSSGFHSVSLMVSRENRRAFHWYQKLGFRIRKEFGAYVWDR